MVVETLMKMDKTRLLGVLMWFFALLLSLPTWMDPHLPLLNYEIGIRHPEVHLAIPLWLYGTHALFKAGLFEER